MALMLAMFLPGFQAPSLQAFSDASAQSISESAALRFDRKLEKIEDFAARDEADEKLSTRFTEEEVNSYLNLGLDSEYRSCLKNIRMAFRKDLIEGVASVDFDCLKQASSKTFSFLLMKLLSGTHVITIRGTIVSGDGKGNIQLEHTRFNDSMIPNVLVDQAVALIGQNQDPPINPMESTKLPLNIKKITIHPGYIMVFQ